MSDMIAPMNMDKDGNPTDGRGAWRQYLCRACGWIYDEKLGDPDGGLPAGSRFEDIPDDWMCPLCGVTKRDFEPFVQRETLAVIAKPCADNGVIVIGGGTAGWTAIEALRKLDDCIPITLITADSGDRYMKPQLSIAISQNKTPDVLITKKATDLAKTLNVNLIAHTFATAIDSDKQVVRTTRGDFGYRHLIIAQGATPFLPPSLPADKVWRINHIEMFGELQAKLSARPNQHIAIIGAGMIGAELAEDIAKAGHQVTLINRDELPLAEILPPIAGQKVQDALTGIGIHYHGSATVYGIDKLADSYQIHLDNDIITVDEIVASTGLITDNRLARMANIEHTPQGIIVDRHTLRSSNPHIFAIGDCIVIDGKPCRFVAPLREQAAAISHEILSLPHAGYQHKSPLVRLKTKSIIVSVTGNPDKTCDWQITDDSETLFVMTQERDGVTTAKIELKL